jgi:hypothetical protein
MMTLHDRLATWVAAGLISEDQATRIIAFERSSPPEPSKRLPLIAEALGYLGGALALIALFILAEQFWADLEVWGRLTLLGVVTLALLIAGWSIRAASHEAVDRLGGFLWAMAVIGAGVWFGLLAVEQFDTAEQTGFLIGSLGALAISTSLWWLRRKSLQHIVLFASLIAVSMATVAQFDHAPDELYGLGLWGLGVIWLFLTWGGVLAPRRTAYAVGAVAALFGPQILIGDRGWPLLLGTVVAAALLAASVSQRELVLLGLGAAGIFLFVPQLVFHYFADSLGAPVALLLSGALLVGGAIALARLKGTVSEEEREEVTL